MINLDNTNIKEINLSVSERPEIPTPEQDIEHIEVRGRNGSLTKKYAFKDIEYKITFDFLESASFKQAFRQAKQVIFNAKKLSFEDDPGIYYKIKSVVIDDATNDILEYGQFTVTFTLDPFAYEETDTIEVTQQTTLNNLGYEAEPYIKCYVAGTGNIYLGDQVITIKDINGFIELDSEMMNAYKAENDLITNLNNHMVGDFLLIPNGQSIVKFDGDISKLEINPRWRWI
ncbi:phage tail protein [Bacillus ginsengihumi]|uniref:Phage tail protein n=1 Tax=Heyndrickxia ginsengihumi TaxID=363870 RepID=A0A6M0PB20_9BACI|nr:phage tail domain-containing protein [Heyndrickxia ginsengihumi]NEY20498.1 phage tail protein [Heyndrickxia ginsengihumi]